MQKRSVTRICFFAFILLTSWHGLLAQTAGIEFTNYSDADGLSSNSIIGITQDSLGFLWFATEDGLNRFDGYRFKSYRKNLADSLTISQNRIEHFYLDRFHNLWLMAGDVVNVFDLETEKVNRFAGSLPNGIPNENISVIGIDSKNNLWIITRKNEIYKTSLTGKTLKADDRFLKFTMPAGITTPNRIWRWKEDSNKTIWLGDTRGNLFQMIPEKNDRDSYRFEKVDPRMFSSGNRDSSILALLTQDGPVYWISAGTELVSYQPGQGQIDRWRVEGGLRGSILIDSNRVWLGTNEGLARLDKKSKNIEYFRYIPGNKNSVAFGIVTCMYVDRQSNLWIGTHNGLSKYSPDERKFFCSRRGTADPAKGLLDNRIRAIASNDNGVVWLGTDQHGLSRYDTKRGEYTSFVHTGKGKNEIGLNTFGALHCEGDTVWITCFFENIQILNDADKTFRLCPNSSSIDYLVRASAMDSLGFLWVGGNNGLCRLDRKNGVVTDVSIHYNGDPVTGIRALATERLNGQNRLCIGTDFGRLHWMTYTDAGVLSGLETHLITESPHVFFGNHTINSICLTPQYIWVGTYGGGLKRFSRDDMEMKTYLQKDGLPNDVIYGILEDSRGDLWMSSNRGISRLLISTNTFINYTPEDGLQGNEYNSGSYARDRQGYFYFGGTNGWNMFHPDSVVENLYEPGIVFTDFQVYNRSIEPGADPDFSKSLNYAGQISLRPDQRVFSFEFSALNFVSTVKNQYAYFLEGYDRDTQYIGNRRFITFTNLSPGDYKLTIKARNNDGVESRYTRELDIRILPAFRETTAFQAALIVLILLGISGIIYAWWKYRRIEKEKELKVRRELEEVLHDGIRKDINLVLRSAELAEITIGLNDLEKSNDLVQKISRVAWSMDFSLKHLTSDFGNEKISFAFLLNLVTEYVAISVPEKSGLTMEVPESPEARQVSGPAVWHLLLIIKECLQNLVRHSECTKSVLTLRLDGSFIVFELRDNGKGFKMDTLERKNGLVHIVERAKKTGGGAEIISAPGQGTVIRVRLRST